MVRMREMWNEMWEAYFLPIRYFSTGTGTEKKRKKKMLFML
jgi:hypothetical protein